MHQLQEEYNGTAETLNYNKSKHQNEHTQKRTVKITTNTFLTFLEILVGIFEIERKIQRRNKSQYKLQTLLPNENGEPLVAFGVLAILTQINITLNNRLRKVKANTIITPQFAQRGFRVNGMPFFASHLFLPSPIITLLQDLMI